MRASQSASPSVPTGTVPAHWAVTATAAMSSSPTRAASRLLAAAVGRLLDPATRKHAQPDRLALAVEHVPVGERDQGDLGAPGPEVDGEDARQEALAAGTCSSAW